MFSNSPQDQSQKSFKTLPILALAPFLFLADVVACCLDTSFCFCTLASLYFNTRSSSTHSSQLHIVWSEKEKRRKKNSLDWNFVKINSIIVAWSWTKRLNRKILFLFTSVISPSYRRIASNQNKYLIRTHDFSLSLSLSRAITIHPFNSVVYSVCRPNAV